MKIRATDAAFWAMLTGLAAGMAWNPVSAWAQARASASSDVFAASGSNPQFSCSSTSATCGITSSAADSVTSTTVAAVTIAPTANIGDSDLVLNVENSAGTNLFTVNESGSIAIPGSQSISIGGYHLSNNVGNGRFFLGSAALTGDGILWVGSIALLTTSGDVLDATAGGYVRIKNGAGAPTGTDCDAAGEAGRLYVDTSNNRWYFCNGAAWQYSNEDVP